MVYVLCINVWKQKSETCWNCSKKGGGGMRENDGGVNLIKIYYKHICKCNNRPPLQLILYASKNVKRNTTFLT
jgi:hypothetical protein